MTLKFPHLVLPLAFILRVVGRFYMHELSQNYLLIFLIQVTYFKISLAPTKVDKSIR